MFETIKSGGILMIPIILCGLAGIYIIIERCIYFFMTKKRDLVLKAQLEISLSQRDYKSCVDACDTAGTPFACVAKKTFEMRSMNENDLKEAVETEVELVIPKLEHSLTLLGTIANVSTLLGLLGTVTGNIKAFGVLGAGGSMGDPALLAGAIAEALVTTAAGLFVAIPAMIFNNYFIRHVNKEIIFLESSVSKILQKLKGRL